MIICNLLRQQSLKIVIAMMSISVLVLVIVIRIQMGAPATNPRNPIFSRLQEDPALYQSYLPFVVSYNVTTHYVSKTGENTGGGSWATAWNELDQIDWEVIQPGDTILLDGGSKEMVYTTGLTVGNSGTEDFPITIRLAEEPGRNGRVVIFGGRSVPLPYCGQKEYAYQTTGVREVGIQIKDVSWIIIDGTKWQGIAIFGHNGRGIQFSKETSNITVKNMEIYDNGMAYQREDEWRSTLPGVGLAGSNITFERVIIHDNGQDAFQSMNGDNGIADFTLRQSWLYNDREHPTMNESFNYCSHTDGVQIYSGRIVSGVTIESSVIGPGFTQGIILGAAENPSGTGVVVNDVTLRNTLFTKAAGINIYGSQDIESRHWVMDHITVYCLTPYTGACLWLEGSNHSVTNSIFVGSELVLPDGLGAINNNCQWDISGFELGRNVDPQFVGVNETDPFSLDDYALLPGSPCAGLGSGVTSVSQLLSISDLE